LDLITKYFVEQIKKEAPNPIDSYGLGVDGRYKFMWFLGLNNYLYVTDKNEVDYKGGALFDKNAPECTLRVYDNYIKPKIVETLDVRFTEEELLNELRSVLENSPELAGEEYFVKSLKEYKSQTSIQYQISEKYGEGKHKLIPNTANIGVGKSEKLKYCSIEEFKEHGLSISDICFKRMMKYIEPFYTTKEEVFDLEQSQ